MNKMMLTMALTWAKDRLREPSTWGGLLVTGAALTGLTLSSEQAATIAQALVVVVGVWQAGRTG